MIEHTPWVGSRYEQGIGGKTVAISGYSHWGDEPDTSDATVKCVEHVIDGTWSISFFDKIMSYFGFSDRSLFWNSVIFFNFVPSLIGSGGNRYAWATEEQKAIGQRRVLRIVEQYKPERLLVFTRKGWCSYPLTIEDKRDGGSIHLAEDQPHAFTYGHYPHLEGATTTIAYGLRHPQYARNDLMRSAVQLAMR